MERRVVGWIIPAARATGAHETAVASSGMDAGIGRGRRLAGVGDRRGEGLPQGVALSLGREALHQPPVRRLAGQTFVEHGLSGAVPDGQPEPRAVGEQAVVVLVAWPMARA